MLKKLLKYDLKYMIKNMSVFYILSIFFAILTRIFFSLKQTVFISLIGQISVGCMFSMTFSCLFNTIIRSWVRFNDSIYKDESYLSHTLPVSKNQLYDSRFIQSIIFSIIGFIFIIVSLFITYFTEERWIMLKDAINALSTNLNVNTTLFIISALLVFFLEIINAIQCGFLGIIAGNSKNDKKRLFSFIYGFISYMASQALVIVFVIISSIFNKGVLDIFKSTVILDNDLLKYLVVVAIISYIVVITLMNIVCKKLFKKGINIE